MANSHIWAYDTLIGQLDVGRSVYGSAMRLAKSAQIFLEFLRLKPEQILLHAVAEQPRPVDRKSTNVLADRFR